MAANLENDLAHNDAATLSTDTTVDTTGAPQPDCDNDQEISEAARMVLCGWIRRCRRRYLARNRHETPTPAPSRGILKRTKNNRKLYEVMMEHADFGRGRNSAYYHDRGNGQIPPLSNDSDEKPAPTPEPHLGLTPPPPTPAEGFNSVPNVDGPGLKKTVSFAMDITLINDQGPATTAPLYDSPRPQPKRMAIPLPWLRES